MMSWPCEKKKVVLISDNIHVFIYFPQKGCLNSVVSLQIPKLNAFFHQLSCLRSSTKSRRKNGERVSDTFSDPEMKEK